MKKLGSLISLGYGVSVSLVDAQNMQIQHPNGESVSPYYCTVDSGLFLFIDLAPGKYTLQIWQPFAIDGGNAYRPMNVPVVVAGQTELPPIDLALANLKVEDGPIISLACPLME